MYIKLILIMLGFISILYIASAIMRSMSNKLENIGHSRYIKILDRVMLGKDRWIYIIQLGDKLYLIGVATGSIKILDEIEPDDLQPIGANQNLDFTSLFKKYSNNFWSKRSNGGDEDGKY